MPKTKTRNADPIWADVMRELGQLADALEGGGMTEVEKRFTVRRVRVVPPPTISATEAKSAREKVGASQAVFAKFLGLSAQTIKAWEQGSRKPVGAANRLLADILAHPDHWRKQIEGVAERTTGV